MNAANPDPLLLVERQDGVLRLTLNRPGARNALSSALMAACWTRWNDAATDTRRG